MATTDDRRGTRPRRGHLPRPLAGRGVRAGHGPGGLHDPCAAVRRSAPPHTHGVHDLPRRRRLTPGARGVGRPDLGDGDPLAGRGCPPRRHGRRPVTAQRRGGRGGAPWAPRLERVVAGLRPQRPRRRHLVVLRHLPGHPGLRPGQHAGHDGVLRPPAGDVAGGHLRAVRGPPGADGRADPGVLGRRRRGRDPRVRAARGDLAGVRDPRHAGQLRAVPELVPVGGRAAGRPHLRQGPAVRVRPRALPVLAVRRGPGRPGGRCDHPPAVVG